MKNVSAQHPRPSAQGVMSELLLTRSGSVQASGHSRAAALAPSSILPGRPGHLVLAAPRIPVSFRPARAVACHRAAAAAVRRAAALVAATPHVVNLRIATSYRGPVRHSRKDWSLARGVKHHVRPARELGTG